MQEQNETCSEDKKDSEEDPENRIYLDLVPVRSFLHTASGNKPAPAKDTSTHSHIIADDQKEQTSEIKEVVEQKVNRVVVVGNVTLLQFKMKYVMFEF